MTFKPAHKQDNPQHKPGQVKNNHELLWQCWRSGQMKEEQLIQHMKEDTTLADYIERIKVREGLNNV